MNPELSTLITKRLKALHQGNTHKFKYLRNRVNRERKICRAKYYENSVQHLKQCKSSSWWNEVKKLSVANSAGGNSEEILKALRPSEHHSKTEKIAVANEINDAFLSPMAEFVPLAPEFFQNLVSNSQNEPTITITAGDVFEKLSKLNPRKAHGPDGIPTWVLKENADILELPVKEILNCSYRECRVPKSWRQADIVAIPKKKPITDINNHLRPISLTPCNSIKISRRFCC
jgi:hypothetical protein